MTKCAIKFDNRAGRWKIHLSPAPGHWYWRWSKIDAIGDFEYSVRDLSGPVELRIYGRNGKLQRKRMYREPSK